MFNFWLFVNPKCACIFMWIFLRPLLCLYRMNQFDRYIISVFHFKIFCIIWIRSGMMDYLIGIKYIRWIAQNRHHSNAGDDENRHWKFHFVRKNTLNIFSCSNEISNFRCYKYRPFSPSKVRHVSEYPRSDEKWAIRLLLFVKIGEWF